MVTLDSIVPPPHKAATAAQDTHMRLALQNNPQTSNSHSVGSETNSVVNWVHVNRTNESPEFKPALIQNPFRDPPADASYAHSSRAASILLEQDSGITTPSVPKFTYPVDARTSSTQSLSTASESSPLQRDDINGYITTKVKNGKWGKQLKKSKRSANAACVPRRQRIVNKITGQLNPQAILHLIDIRPWFWPFTWRKYITLAVLLSIIAGIVVSDHYTHWLKRSLEITRTFMLPVLIISVCTEPLIILTILPVAKMPDIPQNEVQANLDLKENDDPEMGLSDKHEPQGPFETAMITPCHNTNFRTIKTTITSALRHFRPQDIFIVDNAKTKYPTHPVSNFRAYIRTIHPDINYIWSPIGSKNAAQMVGAMAARNKGYKYIMTADDDVCMPKNFKPPTAMIDDTFKAVAYPLKAMDADCKSSLWLVAWQDVEYRLSGLAKLAEDRLCGVQFPHGAGWFVEIDSFIELMEKHHPMDFIAEDCNSGLGFSKMNKGIRMEAQSFLATEVPTTFFGPGLNWWAQRQKSWEMGRHGLLLSFIRELIFSMPPKKTIQGIFWHKTTFLYNICTIIIDWIRVPVFVALGQSWQWWRNAFCLMLFSSIPPLLYNYWKCRRRKDMRVNTWAAITYPWYKLIYNFVCLTGAIRCAFYYIGGHQKAPPIRKMLKDQDWRCFWLDPKFKENPAFLADEAEALASEKLSSPDASIFAETPYSSDASTLTEDKRVPAPVITVDEISIDRPVTSYSASIREKHCLT